MDGICFWVAYLCADDYVGVHHFAAFPHFIQPDRWGFLQALFPFSGHIHSEPLKAGGDYYAQAENLKESQKAKTQVDFREDVILRTQVIQE